MKSVADFMNEMRTSEFCKGCDVDDKDCPMAEVAKQIREKETTLE